MAATQSIIASESLPNLIGSVLAAAAAGYAWLAAYAVRVGAREARAARRRRRALARPVSVLKPLCGAEPGLHENLRSFCLQRHPCFQLLFGVRSAEDAAIPVVRRLQAEFPQIDIELVIDARAHGSNPKVGSLLNMLPRARYDWLVLADSDIKVPSDYLTRVTARLAEPGVGVVTCLYRGLARGGFWPRLGVLFIDDWFAPSVRVSHSLGWDRFAFGATIAMRRESLRAAGGFEAVSDVLADDFWLGEFTRLQGLRTVLSEVVVTTDVTDSSFAALWAHELRWLRTIRGAAPAGFALSFITFTFPVLAAALALAPTPGCLAIAAAGAAARLWLHLLQRRKPPGSSLPSELLLVPFRDTLSLLGWGAAHFGSRVTWRGRILDASVQEARRLRPAASRPGLIITADDFGLHHAVNAAVEIAHRHGVLTTASLMVGAPAAADAVARARRLPGLRVGLHLVLAEGAAVLPRAQIPALVDAAGHFGSRMGRDGVRFFLLPWVRRQLEAEIRAQFEAFAATGLPLDHVNAHKHFHLHPTVLSLILRVGEDYGLRAVRLPAEAGAPLWLRPWLALLARRLQAAGIAHNDAVVGLRHSGRMSEGPMLEALRNLPPGVTEIYLHPATLSRGVSASMPDYQHAEELAALLSPRVRGAVDGLGATRGGYADFFGPPGEILVPSPEGLRRAIA